MLSESRRNGRIECPDCGSRNTEIIHAGYRQTKKTLACRDCNNEWKHYTGPECPSCGSNNTRRVKMGVPLHTSSMVKCYDCSHGPVPHLLENNE